MQLVSDPGLSVFWVSGMSVSAFEESYRQIALALGISTNGDIDSMLMRRVKNWLEGPLAGRWLMVVDNVDDVPFFRDNQLQFIPNNQYGFLIFTSRDSGLATYLKRPVVIKVSRMSLEDSVALILSSNVDANPEDAVTLVESLDNHPLAISQALAFSRNLGMTLDQYLELLTSKEKHKERLLRYEFVSPGRERGMESLESTFVVSLHELQERTPQAIDVLSLMSFFDASSIPVSLLAKEYKDKLAFSEALNALRTFSLINVNHDGSAYAVHPLVQLVTKGWVLSKENATTFRLRALRLLCQHIPDYEEANWKESFELLPHVDHVLSFDTREPSSDVDFARAELMIKVTPFFAKKGKFGTAEKMAREALEITFRLFNSESQNRGRAFVNLASVLHAEGQYQEALKCVNEGLEILEQTAGTAEGPTLDALGLLGLVMQSLGDYSKALAIHRKELGLRRARRGGLLDNESPAILNSMMSLALVLDRKGEYEKAEKVYQQTLDGRKKLLGPQHPETLMCQSDLAVTLQHLAGSLPDARKMEFALELQSEALKGLEDALGQDSPWSMKALARLASIKKDLGDLSGSELAYTKALQSMKSILGEGHPETLECLADLGNVYFLEGKFGLAESTFQSSIEILMLVLGAEHPQTLTMMKRKAMFLQSQGRLNEAEAIYCQVLATRQEVLGAKHPDTVDSTSDLISVLSDLGRSQEGANLAIVSSGGSVFGSPQLRPVARHMDYMTLPEENHRGGMSSRMLSLKTTLEQESAAADRIPKISLQIQKFPTEWHGPDIEQVNKWIIDRKRKGRRPENLVDDFMLEMIGRRDHLFIIDNNISMQRHWGDIEQVLKALSYIIGMADSDGVDIMTGDHRYSSRSGLDPGFEPHWTLHSDLMITLERTLEMYRDRIQSTEGLGVINSRFRLRDSKNVKPLTVYILTDGIWMDELRSIPTLVDSFYSGLSDNPNRYEKPLALQFIVFGEDSSWKRLQQLDDSYNPRYGTHYDVIDTTRSTGNVRKMLLGSFVTSFDDWPDLLPESRQSGSPVPELNKIKVQQSLKEEFQNKNSQTIQEPPENAAASTSNAKAGSLTPGVKEKAGGSSRVSLKTKGRMLIGGMRERARKLFGT